MSEPTPTLTLWSEGLLSKWGFSDGDAPEQWLDYCDERGIAYTGWHAILSELVRHFLLPALDQQVTTVEIGCNHNPIRAETVNGNDVTDCWYDSSRDVTGMLTPESVTVPMADVAAVALEIAERTKPAPAP